MLMESLRHIRHCLHSAFLFSKHTLAIFCNATMQAGFQAATGQAELEAENWSLATSLRSLKQQNREKGAGNS